MDFKSCLQISSSFPFLGRVFRSYRKRAGLTQSEVGEAIGHSTPQFVSNVERGICFYSLDHLRVFIEKKWVTENEIIFVLNLATKYHISLNLFGKKSRITKESALQIEEY